MKRFGTLLIAGIALTVGARAGTAQQAAPKAPELVGGILAVVGDSVILDTEIEEQIRYIEQACVAARAQNKPCSMEVKRDDPKAMLELKKQLLETKVNDLVLFQAALRDTTNKVDEMQLLNAVNKEIEQRKTTVGGDQRFEEALRQQRMTLQDFRTFLSNDFRRQTLIRQYVGKLTRERKPPPISENRLRELFAKQKAAGQIPARPATIGFSQVVLPPRASDSARAVARGMADSLLAMIVKGGDFEALAKQYSEDTGSKDQGGLLGWTRTGELTQDFERAVFSMVPGQISPVVETPFGFHIIKLERVKGAERQARHILIKPVATDADAEANFQRGREIAEKLRAGANVDSMAKAVGDPDEDSRIGPLPRDQLGQVPQYQSALGDAKLGDVVGPFSLPTPGGTDKIVIVKITEAREAGDESLDDSNFHQMFRERLQTDLLIEELVAELRRQTHVEIRL